MKRLMLRNSRGQAVTEFAIALPVMVMIFLFSQYFYEAVQVKLKSQEMARYAAWEFTGHELTDYKAGEMRYSTVKTDVANDTNTRFSNLKSTDKLSNATRAFAGSWDVKNIRTTDKKEPRIPGGTMANIALQIFGYALDAWRVVSAAQHPNIIYAAAVGWFTYERNTQWGLAGGNVFNPPPEWKMNGKGLIKADSNIRFTSSFIPRKMPFFNEGGPMKGLQFKETVVLLADSWKLEYGEDVEGNSSDESKETAFFKQVDRMVLVRKTPRQIFKVYNDIIRVFTNITATLAFQPWLQMKDLGETTLVSKNYTDGDPDSGKIEIEEDNDKGGPTPYDSAPMLKDSGYQKSLESRANNYMGCPEPESMGCTSSLSTDNPFGDYIVPSEIE